MKTKHELEWKNRYSSTEEPDKYGRWARICYYNGLTIAWINRVESYGDVQYSISTYFPINSNDNPCYLVIFDTFEEAQTKVTELWEEFVKHIIE